MQNKHEFRCGLEQGRDQVTFGGFPTYLWLRPLTFPSEDRSKFMDETDWNSVLLFYDFLLFTFGTYSISASFYEKESEFSNSET